MSALRSLLHFLPTKQIAAVFGGLRLPRWRLFGGLRVPAWRVSGGLRVPPWRLLGGLRVPPWRSFRLGIAARLSISFIGVAALILATNLVVQRGIMVESTTRLTAAAPYATPVAPKAEPAHIEPLPAPPPPPPPPPRPTVLPSVLEPALSALAHFERASQPRVHSNSAPIDKDYRQAASHLGDTLKTLMVKSSSVITESAAGRISSQLRAYTASAGALIQVADTRRVTETARIALLERLNARVKQSLAGSWTVFGRVVARQSLVQLSAQMDTLQQNSEALTGDPPIAAAQLTAIIDAEQRVKQTIALNENGFRRSQGNDWYLAMTAGLTQLSALRQSSTELSTEISDRMQTFADQGDQLRHSLFRAVSPPPPPPPRQTAAHAVPQSKVAPSPVPLPVRAASPGAAAAPAPPRAQPMVETRLVRSVSPDPSSRRAVAWASGVAAAFMLIMCVGIVVSIVAPVRRLLRATAEIAAGKDSVHVASGGITELDTLATAFNKMVDELAVAKAASREYQQTLEEKIVERTRRLQELSERDPLTGLVNRRHLFALLDTAIERAHGAGHLVGVLFLDIDNFKYINDGMGHAFGDSVLISMGKRLESLAGSHGFAARLGGDEFTVIVERAGAIDDIRSIGEAIVAAFQAPLMVENRELVVSVSVGASAYPIHAKAADALLKAADMALFRAKALGRSQLSIFTSDLLDVAAAKFATEQGLRRAIERSEFELFFQPEINAETLEIGLVEALIRWRGASGLLLSPGEFLAVAEESGLAIDIGDWVLRSAISAASAWQKEAWPEARVAINVSPRQLTDSNFVDRVLELLTEYQLPARCIEIELTESVLQTGPSTLAALRKLRANGIAVALDDFGTGYSSLASLETLPVTRIKLDRSLICGIGNSARSVAIAEAMIGMCQGLGLEITAEGVERPEQFTYLVRKRSMFIQGYLLARPVPPDELLPLMAIVKQRARELLITAGEMPGMPAVIPRREAHTDRLLPGATEHTDRQPPDPTDPLGPMGPMDPTEQSGPHLQISALRQS